MGRSDNSSVQRPTGLTKSAGWEVGAQRTYHLPVETVWDFLVSADGLRVWLGDLDELPPTGERYVTASGTRGEVRSIRPLDRVRVTWQPPGRDAPAILQVAVVSTSTGTAVRFHQEKLASGEERSARRAALEDVLDWIGEELSRWRAPKAAAVPNEVSR